jgi:hypothetical protein
VPLSNGVNMYLVQNRFGLIFPMILCLCSAAPLRAAQFHVTVGSEGKTAGSTISIPIVVSAEVTVGAAQLELLYDPGRLRWVGGDAGKLTANTLIDANLLDPGRARIAFAGGEDVTGTGTIYQANFEWTDSQSGPTNLRFAAVRAWDQATGLELATSASPGDAIPAIATPATPAPDQTAAPPTTPPNYLLIVGLSVAVLFLVAAGLMVLRKKSKN